MWLSAAFNLILVPFYIPMIFIVLFWDIYLWYNAFTNSSGLSYSFTYNLYLAILFGIYWLCLPLGFLSGLFFAIPSAFFIYVGYTGDAENTAGKYAYVI